MFLKMLLHPWNTLSNTGVVKSEKVAKDKELEDEKEKHKSRRTRRAAKVFGICNT